MKKEVVHIWDAMRVITLFETFDVLVTIPLRATKVQTGKAFDSGMLISQSG